MYVHCPTESAIMAVLVRTVVVHQVRRLYRISTEKLSSQCQRSVDRTTDAFTTAKSVQQTSISSSHNSQLMILWCYRAVETTNRQTPPRTRTAQHLDKRKIGIHRHHQTCLIYHSPMVEESLEPSKALPIRKSILLVGARPTKGRKCLMCTHHPKTPKR